jgi:hypothetical protein
LSLGNLRCHAVAALRLDSPHSESSERNREEHPRTDALSLHLFNDAAHRSQEHRQLSSLGYGVRGVEAMLARIVIPGPRA